MFNEEMETLSIGEKENLQLKRLQQTAKLVYENVPFYKNKFNTNHVEPKDIKSLGDIQKLPFTVKKDLRDNYPFGLFAKPVGETKRIHASSGTSGKPTVVGFTGNDLGVWQEIVARAIAACGGEPGGILHNAYGYGLFTGGLGIHYGSEKLGMVTVPISGGNTDRQITLIEDFRPTVITATPSYVLNIIEQMEKMGKNPRETSLKYGIFGAETWSEEMRKTLETRLGIKAMDIYGLSEVMGPGIAIECKEAQDGLHIADDHFLVEVIDPDTLEPVREGEEGELVFTSLTKEALPIIRYRTGDIASISKDPCSCGRTSIRMSRVKGRIDDMLIIRGVNVFPSEIESALLEVPELVPHYQLVIKNNGAMDQVTLKVEINDQFYQSINENMEHEHIRFLSEKICKKLKNSCLVTIDAEFAAPGKIHRSEGKAIRIVRETEVSLSH
ncbi:phenylacetate--CoA ligase family protein [Oceanobacillus sp. J11TS1]|uniref:phenylacetate--CoA ligase family protein n=1 Tax=Oceanobacillus sp. J11TS1 TaxID=2807191 RepID=UPI001BB42642|nr:AMP-binding protein [Oceanobacillus sp. J11TS1]